MKRNKMINMLYYWREQNLSETSTQKLNRQLPYAFHFMKVQHRSFHSIWEFKRKQKQPKNKTTKLMSMMIIFINIQHSVQLFPRRIYNKYKFICCIIMRKHFEQKATSTGFSVVVVDTFTLHLIHRMTTWSTISVHLAVSFFFVYFACYYFFE